MDLNSPRRSARLAAKANAQAKENGSLPGTNIPKAKAPDNSQTPASHEGHSAGRPQASQDGIDRDMSPHAQMQAEGQHNALKGKTEDRSLPAQKAKKTRRIPDPSWKPSQAEDKDEDEADEESPSTRLLNEAKSSALKRGEGDKPLLQKHKKTRRILDPSWKPTRGEGEDEASSDASSPVCEPTQLLDEASSIALKREEGDELLPQRQKKTRRILDPSWKPSREEAEDEVSSNESSPVRKPTQLVDKAISIALDPKGGVEVPPQRQKKTRRVTDPSWKPSREDTDDDDSSEASSSSKQLLTEAKSTAVEAKTKEEVGPHRQKKTRRIMDPSWKPSQEEPDDEEMSEEGSPSMQLPNSRRKRSRSPSPQPQKQKKARRVMDPSWRPSTDAMDDEEVAEPTTQTRGREHAPGADQATNTASGGDSVWRPEGGAVEEQEIAASVVQTQAGDTPPEEIPANGAEQQDDPAQQQDLSVDGDKGGEVGESSNRAQVLSVQSEHQGSEDSIPSELWEDCRFSFKNHTDYFDNEGETLVSDRASLRSFRGTLEALSILKMPLDYHPEPSVQELIERIRKERRAVYEFDGLVEQDKGLEYLASPTATTAGIACFLCQDVFPQRSSHRTFSQVVNEPLPYDSRPDDPRINRNLFPLPSADTGPEDVMALGEMQPDLLYTLSTDRLDSEQQAKLCAMAQSGLGDCTVFPPLVLHVAEKSEYPPEGHRCNFAAANLSLMTTACCVNMLRILSCAREQSRQCMLSSLSRFVLGSEPRTGSSTAVFSVVTDGVRAYLHVSWLCPKKAQYLTHQIQGFKLSVPEEYIELCRWVDSILYWAATERFDMIKEALDAISLEEAREIFTVRRLRPSSFWEFQAEE